MAINPLAHTPDTPYPAPAKLNLFLHITGRTDKGYHTLESLFCLIDYADQLYFKVRSDGVVLRTNPVEGVSEAEDLCVRAARLLQQKSQCPLGVEITLDKRIPMGGGLGGGSSDAATTLLVLNQLWQLGYSRAQLQAFGLALGADVPFFVFGQTAFAQGIGEVLQPYPHEPQWFVVLTPDAHVSTAEIFSHPDLTRNTKSIIMHAYQHCNTQNDLQAVVCRLEPKVEQAINYLQQHGKSARMTGSGACVFLPCTTQEKAKKILQDAPLNLSGFVAQELAKHPLWAFADS